MGTKNLLGGGTEDSVLISAPPQSLTFTKSASAFTQVQVNNYGLLVPVAGSYDGSQVRYRNARATSNSITNNEFFLAKSGVCPLPASGQWWVSVNTNIAAGTFSMVLYDFPSLECMLAMMSALQNTTGTTRLMSAAATATVTGASTSIVAANANRSACVITHTGTTNGTTVTGSILYLAFGAAAVVGSGIALQAGQSLSMDMLNGLTLQEIRGISTSGNICVGVQEGL